MKFIFNDGGRSNYTSIPSNTDCAQRAIAIAAGLSYVDVQNATAALQTSEGTNVASPAFEEYMASLGFIKVEGVTSMQALPHGRVIASTYGHYTAIIDGVINDVRDESNKSVGHYWVRGTRFNVVNRSGHKLNTNGSLNGAQALQMRRLFNLNFGGGCQIKAA